MRNDIHTEAVDWALRLHGGCLNEADQRRLDNWLSRSPKHRRALEQARELLGPVGDALKDDPDFTRSIIRQRQARTRTVLPFILLAGIAAGGIFMGTGGLVRLRADVVTAGNEMTEVQLADGTRVFLNGKSAFAEHFTASERRVTLLDGEAYFEVAKDAARPFTVEAGAGRIRVTGTAFNINITDDGTEVVVTEHAVVVTGNASTAGVEIAAGEKLSYDDAGTLGAVETAPASSAALWRKGRLIFENRRLATVAEEIFRHLPGRVIIARPSVADRRISGSFDLSSPQEALESFSSAFGVRTVSAGKLLTIIY